MKKDNYTKLDIVLLICILISTIITLLSYLGLKPSANWPIFLAKSFNFLFIKISLIWYVLFTLVALLVKNLFFSFRKDSKDIPQKLVEEKINTIEGKEELILLYLSKYDGKSKNVENINSELKFPLTELKYYLENLRKQGYIRKSSGFSSAYNLNKA